MTAPTDDPAEIFIDETIERLDEMDTVLLAIESGHADADAVDTLFRGAHTIKGAAAMLGMARIEALGHAVEDVLAVARDAGAMPAGLVAPLLRATAAIRQEVTGDADAQAADVVIADLASSQATPQGAGERPADPSRPADVAGSGDGRQAKRNGQDSRTERSEQDSRTERSEQDSRTERSEQDSRTERSEQDGRTERSGQAGRGGHPRPLRVSAEKIDLLLDLVGEVVHDRRALAHALGGGAPQDVVDVLAAGDRTLEQLKDVSVGMRTLPLSVIAGPLPRTIRELARSVGKDVELIVTGADTELDRVILESLPDPLTHLLRNAVSHGIETADVRTAAGKPERGRVEFRAEPRGSLVEIMVRDDGQGVSAEVMQEARREGSLTEVLCRAGYSTAGEVTELAGRGVGMNAVKTYVESLGGSLEIRSEPGQGTEVILMLPVAMALLEVLLFERDSAVFGVPLAAVEEVLPGTPNLALGGTPSIDVRGHPVLVTDFAAVVGATARPLDELAPALLVSAGGSRAVLSCDALIGQQEVLVKPLGPLLAGVGGYLGAAILGDGRITLLVEPSFVTRRQHRAAAAPPAVVDEQPATKILVAEDSFTVRELQRSILETAGYRVVTARDGREALHALRRDPGIALVVTDLDMPELGGLELTKSIRADPARSSLPVVIVTSHASDEERRRGIDVGADAYMSKHSFDQHALLTTVERLVGR